MNKLKKHLIPISVVTVLALVGLFTAVTTIGTGQVGVVTNYGRVTGRELGEGIAMKLPFGVESVAVYDVKVQKETAATAAAIRVFLIKLRRFILLVPLKYLSA